MNGSRFGLGCLLYLTACASRSSPPGPAVGAEVAPIGPAPPGRLGDLAAPNRYELELEIDPRQERFRGLTRIDLTLRGPAAHVWLHGRDLSVAGARATTATGEVVPATYEQRLPSGVALVRFDRPLTGAIRLEIRYDAPFDTSLNGLYRVERDGLAYAATQFQPIAARKVFPGFDEPGFKVPFEITLVVPEGAVAVTNTPEVRREVVEGGLSRRIYAPTRPLPTYLLAFAVGPYDENDFGEIPPNEVRERPLPLRAFAGRGLGPRLAYALEQTPGILGLLETYFGSPYPYRKLDLISPPEGFGGAMENAGAVMYDEYLLLLDDAAPLAQKRSHVVVHAHELAHMWFGDLVTPEWWDDLWLNESFASWMMNWTAHAHWPEGGFGRRTLAGALEAMSADSLASARQIREPVTRSEAIADAFDAITYRKGAGVLAMLEAYAGADAFRSGVRLHMTRFAHGVADADDFMASLAEGSGRPELETAFRSFIEQPGVPLVTVDVACDADGAEVTLTQERYAPLGSTVEPSRSTWTLPLCLRRDDERVCTVLEAPETTLRWPSCPKRVHPNAGGKGYFRFSLGDALWSALLDDATSLPPAEALVLGDSLAAIFRAGDGSARRLLDGLQALAGHPAWDVVEQAADQYESVVGDLVEGTPAEAEARARGRGIFRPRFEALEDAKDNDDVLLRRRLLRFLVLYGQDPELRRQLLPRAERYLGIDGAPDPSAVDPNLLETTLTVGVQDGGPRFVAAIAELAATSSDPAIRDAAAAALGRTEDLEVQRALLGDVLARRFPVQVGLRIVRGQLARPATQEATLAWLETNATEVIELVPGTFRSGFAAAGSVFCSAEKAETWRRFVEAHAELLPGYERSLAQALESTRLCAALEEARQGELVEALIASGRGERAR